jgi:chaperonin GroES
MALNIQPLADNVVAEQDAAEMKTASGIFLSAQAAEKPKTAKVLAVGSKVTSVKKGDRILYKSYSTTDVRLDGSDYILLKEEDILATVN